MSILNIIISMLGDGAIAGCSYGKRNLDNDTISSCKKKCFDKIKCPECLAEFEVQNLNKSEYANDNLIILFVILTYSDFTNYLYYLPQAVVKINSFVKNFEVKHCNMYIMLL